MGIPAEVLGASDRVVPLAESALHAPQAGFGGVELYPDLLDKAAVLCSRLARNHPLPDGNKRVAFVCLAEFLERNGLVVVPQDVQDPDEEVASLIEQLASGALAEDQFAAWLRLHVRDVG